ncbi:MAG: DEAD/DEAH box helicase [Gammaproteobacteria bacterium]|jgi:ATP-dependent RNA helicase RhlE
MSFKELGLSDDLLRALKEKGYNKPTPIQQKAIPAIIDGNDIMAAAQTGTGKTAGFTLPILQLLSDKAKVKSNRVRALVLTPTRELAAQVQENIFTYSKYTRLRSAVVFGGVSINPQMMKLRKGVDVLVATPGRLLDLYQQNAVRFDDLEILVLDEADRMLDMGFIHDIKKIMALLPKQRQNLMFSATFSKEIRKLAKGIIHDPVEIDVTPRNSTVDKISQIIHPVDKARKIDLLSYLIKQGNWQQVLVFSRTKHGSDKLVRKLAKHNIHAAAIHGNKSQSQRTKALANFKKNKIQVLIATDIASRGIDINQLSHVINFDLPDIAEDYVHRIGRTGRAGATGHAISLVCADEIKQLMEIEKLIQFKIDREEIEGFEAEHSVPDSIKIKSSHKKKRSKKPNRNQASDKKGFWKKARKKSQPKTSKKAQNRTSKNNNNNKRKDYSAAKKKVA